MVAAQQVTRGSLSPSGTNTMIITELRKAKKFLKERKELATTALNSLPGTKNEKLVFKTQVGSELNVDQRGKAALTGRATLIKAQIKQAGNTLNKERKALLEAQAEAAEAMGNFLEAITSGRSSFEAAFKKKKGWFFGGYTVADRFIRASISLAEKGGNDRMALENLKALEEFKEIPVISAALAKNAEKIAKLKSKAEDSRTAPFEEISEASNPYGNVGNDGASVSDGLTPEAASRLAKQLPGQQ